MELDRGRADIEVDEIHPRNNLQITVAGASTRLLKAGLYAFDADKDNIRVFKGEAELQERGDNQKLIKVKGDREVQLAESETIKPASFDRNQAKDSLYQWSSLRSQYLAEANMNLASAYAGYGGMTPGWYWDAGFWGYTWLPGDGLLWNPFGWGFYSPGTSTMADPCSTATAAAITATMAEAMPSSTAMEGHSTEQALVEELALAAEDSMAVEGTAAVVKRR